MNRASVAPLIRVLGNLTVVLGKGAAYAEAKKIDPSVLINSRLLADMFAFARQVQITTDNAKGGLGSPKYEDTESSFPELFAPIDKTVAYLKTFKPVQIDGSEVRTISLKRGEKTINFLGMPYLLNLVLPDIYFHTTTAYNILRHCDVDVGKTDHLEKY